MKRRSVIRVVTAFASASVFGAAGWLMGARALTMPPAPPSPCTTFCTYHTVCSYNGTCLSGNPQCNSITQYVYSIYATCPPEGPWCTIDVVNCICCCSYQCNQ
jgi:hypothetical protein